MSKWIKLTVVTGLLLLLPRRSSRQSEVLPNDSVLDKQDNSDLHDKNDVKNSSGTHRTHTTSSHVDNS